MPRIPTHLIACDGSLTSRATGRQRVKFAVRHADDQCVKTDPKSLTRPYLRGAVSHVGAQGVWPRSFVVSYDDDGRRWRAEFTVATDGAALYVIEDLSRLGMVDPPVVGWLSWLDGEVVTAFRDIANARHGGAILADIAPAADGSLDMLAMDVERWKRLAVELTRTVRAAAKA